MGNTTTALSARPTEYDLPRLEKSLREYGYDCQYLPETTSTMDVAKDFGLIPTVVIADYQSAGRGRHGNDWQAHPGRSVLMTIVEAYNEEDGDPPVDSALPVQLCAVDTCEGLAEVTESREIRVKWLNDLVARHKKLGGILIENTRYKGSQRPYPKLFGIGINVHYQNTDAVFPGTDYGAISLDELKTTKAFDRTDVVLAVVKRLTMTRIDMKVINRNPQVFRFHEGRLNAVSSLSGQLIRISNIGPKHSEVVEGKVVGTPLGRGLMLDVDGTIIEIREYTSKTKVEVLSEEVHAGNT